jgi:hypothetical protein
VKDLRILSQPVGSRSLRRIQRASPVITRPNGTAKIKGIRARHIEESTASENRSENDCRTILSRQDHPTTL